jgi:hypothetical protein
MFRRANMRAATCLLVLAGLLAACDRKPSVPERPARRAAPMIAAAAKKEPPTGENWFTQAAGSGQSLGLAYTHAVGLEITGGAITTHFDAARDNCLKNPLLHCILLRADFTTLPAGNDAAPLRHEGNLAVRLPHDQIAGFAASLTQPLQGEPAGLVRVTRQAMTADDLSAPIADIGQRVAQLQSYLTSLKALGDRLTIGVADLVKIASETSRTQTEIEAAQFAQRNLSQQVNTEELDISFAEPAPLPPAADPIAQSWSGARATFNRNVAAALDAAIAAAPWVPLALLGIILLWVARLVLFGRRRK